MFQKNIKKIAIQTAVLLFFAMSLVGWVCGLPTSTCASRAAIGATATFVIVRLAGQLIVRVLVNAIIDQQINQVKGPTQE
jgi:hypothetical protein